MSNPDEKPTAADPVAAMAAFWSQWLEQSSRGTQALWESMQSACDPQQAQGAWLDAVARSLEDFMRSPAFLETMKRNLKALTDMRAMQDQIVQGVAGPAGVPSVGDISGLFERLKGTEQAILDRLRAIEARLEAIEARRESGRRSGPSHS